MITRTKIERRFKPARHITLTIVFTFIVLFAFAAGTSECEAAAADSTTDITIHCGSGHEAFAAQLKDELDMDSNEELTVYYENHFYILNTQAVVSGTEVTVTCPNISLHHDYAVTLGALRKGISQILTRMSGNAGYSDVHGYTLDNGELLWNSQVSYYASYFYESITNYGGRDYYQAYETYLEDVDRWGGLCGQQQHNQGFLPPLGKALHPDC